VFPVRYELDIIYYLDEFRTSECQALRLPLWSETVKPIGNFGEIWTYTILQK
jgi:hypothetical protein